MTTTVDLTVGVSREPGLLSRAAALRADVFTGEQGVDPAIEVDGRDAVAVHVVATREAPDGSQVLATARLLDSGDRALVGRVAVVPGLRGQGLGAAVMRALERAALDIGLTVVELHAQAGVEGFYARLGYLPVGDHYLEAGIDHVTMTRDLVPGLRSGRDDDAEPVQQLIGGVWAEYPGCVLDVDGEEPWMRAPATAYDAPGKRLWVVESPDGGLLACVGLRPEGDDGFELKSLYVAAQARRRGLGRALTRLVEREARLAGRLRGRLWTDTRFHDAHAAYEALGWRHTGVGRDLNDLSSTSEHEMVRDLARGEAP